MKLKRVKLSTLRDTAVQASIDVDDESAISTSEKDVVHSRKRSYVSNEESSESTDKRRKKQVTSNVIEESKSVKENPTETMKKSIKSDNLISKHPTDKKAETDNTGVDELCNDRTVYIEGLPYDSTDADVSLFFESCGEIKSIRLPKWHDSDRLRGYGHVQFSSIESVKEALTLDG
jgi:RNA recognition motif-containing protein